MAGTRRARHAAIEAGRKLPAESSSTSLRFGIGTMYVTLPRAGRFPPRFSASPELSLPVSVIMESSRNPAPRRYQRLLAEPGSPGRSRHTPPPYEVLSARGGIFLSRREKCFDLPMPRRHPGRGGNVRRGLSGKVHVARVTLTRIRAGCRMQMDLRGPYGRVRRTGGAVMVRVTYPWEFPGNVGNQAGYSRDTHWAHSGIKKISRGFSPPGPQLPWKIGPGCNGSGGKASVKRWKTHPRIP